MHYFLHSSKVTFKTGMPPLIYITEKSVQKTGVQRYPSSL